MLSSIRNKISFTYIIFSAAALLAFTLIIEYSMEQQIRRNIENHLLSEIDFLSHYLEDASGLQNDSLGQKLRRHTAQASVRFTVIDSSGVVLFDTDVENNKLHELENHLSRPEIRLASVYGTGKDVRHSKSTNRDYLYIARRIHPLITIPGLQNTLYLRGSFSLAEMQAQTVDMRKKILGAGGFSLLLILGLSIYVSGRITRPVRKLIAGVDKIAHGDYSLQVSVKSNDELRQLSDSINRLTEKINSDVIELERLATVRSQFLANVSHELRTPLFSIQAFLETLLKGAISDPEVNKKYLNKALFNVNRLNFLLNDLIEISRIESGELKLSFRYFSLEELFLLLKDAFRDAADKKNIKLLFQPAGGLRVFGDKSKLQQVFSNLIDNGIKYNPEGTTINIGFTDGDSSISFSVGDDGTGIPGEHLPRLFERFYRIDRERSRETGGTGLGLAIVKHIVEAHNSTIKVESEPGKGTVFIFTLIKQAD